MTSHESSRKSRNRIRLSVYFRRPGTLQALKMLAITDPRGVDRKIRVNDLVNDALEKYVREMIDMRLKDGSKAEMFWDFLDRAELTGPGDPDYPDDATIERIHKETKKEYEDEES